MVEFAQFDRRRIYILLDEERICSHCGKTKDINEFPKCKRSLNGHKRYCKSCGKEMKREFKETHPVEHKIRQMAENLHKRMTTSKNDPRNKSYLKKNIKCLIGSNSSEIYKYIYEHFYNDVKQLLDAGEVPSIDRINSNDDYRDDNIRIISFSENARLGRETSKKVCSKPIEITFPDDRKETYSSITEAGKTSGISGDIIANVLRKRVKHKKDFSVRYLDT